MDSIPSACSHGGLRPPLAMRVLAVALGMAIGVEGLVACQSGPGTTVTGPPSTMPTATTTLTESIPSQRASPTSTPSSTDIPPATLVLNLDRWSSIPGAVNLAWSPDGHTIAVTGADGLSLLDGATLGEVASQTTQHGQNALVFAENGSRLATADGWEAGQTITVWGPRSLNLVGDYGFLGTDPEHVMPVMQLGLSEEGRIVSAVSETSGLGIWTTTGGPLRRMLTVEGAEPITAALGQGGELLAVSVGPAEAVQVWDTADGVMLQEAPLSGALRLEFRHDSASLVALLDFTAVLWDLENARAALRIPIAGGTLSETRIPYDVAISWDDRILASGTEIPSPGIGLWDLDTGELLALLVHKDLERVIGLSFSPVADELAVLLNDGRLEVWSVQG